MNVTFIGASKVGRAMARALRGGGHTVTLRAARRGPPTKPVNDGLLVLATRDADLAPLAEELAARRAVSRRTVVLHVAGALGPEILSPLSPLSCGVGQAHPLMSFASTSAPPNLAGGHLLVSGDPVAIRRAGRLARALGMVPRQWPSVDRTGYHAAAGLVANGAAALAAAGATLLERSGVPKRDIPRALGPLLRSVGENVTRLGLPTALTGPVRRGDARTIERHLARVEERAPEIGDLYVASARAQLAMARALGDAPPEAFDRVERILDRRRRRAKR